MNRGAHAKCPPKRIKDFRNDSDALSSLASLLIVTVFLEAVEVWLPRELTVEQIKHLHGEETLVYKSKISALFRVISTIGAKSLVLVRMYPLSFPDILMVFIDMISSWNVEECVAEPDVTVVEDAKQDQLLVESWADDGEDHLLREETTILFIERHCFV